MPLPRLPPGWLALGRAGNARHREQTSYVWHHVTANSGLVARRHPVKQASREGFPLLSSVSTRAKKKRHSSKSNVFQFYLITLKACLERAPQFQENDAQGVHVNVLTVLPGSVLLEGLCQDFGCHIKWRPYIRMR